MFQVKTFEIYKINKSFHLVDSIVVQIKLYDVDEPCERTVDQSVDHVVLQIHVTQHFALTQIFY